MIRSMLGDTGLGRAGALLVAASAVLSDGCASSQPRPTEMTATVGGIVEVSQPVPAQYAVPGAQQFLGVRLRTGESQPYILGYQIDALWRAFDGKQVVVTGERYEPARGSQDQILAGPHLRPTSWRLAPEPGPGDSITEVGPEQTLRGTFKEKTWPYGTKLAGETETLFESGGDTYHLMHTPQRPPFGPTVTIKARRIEPSRFATHPSGKYLWVSEITSD